MMRGVEPLCWEERLGELGLGNLGRRRVRRDLITASQYITGREETASLNSYSPQWPFNVHRGLTRKTERDSVPRPEVTGDGLKLGGQV